MLSEPGESPEDGQMDVTPVSFELLDERLVDLDGPPVVGRPWGDLGVELRAARKSTPSRSDRLPVGL